MHGQDERICRIAALLLAHRNGTEDWGDISHFRGRRCPKSIANRFLLCCLLDWQMKTDLAWANGERLVKDILRDPENIWDEIRSISESQWISKREEYRLHRFPAGHNRLWPIANRMVEHYDGDAANLWWGKESSKVLDELWLLGAGEQISRMIVGALRDCGQIVGSSDVKADVHVCRVLGRAISGAPINTDVATKLSRQLNPEDPWQLDWPIWNLGNSYCKKNTPSCSGCYLAPDCAYSQTI